MSTQNQESLETSLVTLSNAVDLSAQVILRMDDATKGAATSQVNLDNLRELAVARLAHNFNLRPVAPASVV